MLASDGGVGSGGRSVHGRLHDADLFSEGHKHLLEQPDSDKGPRRMPCSKKGISVLVKILIIIHRTKSIFRHEQ